jgi:hypothetical protein
MDRVPLGAPPAPAVAKNSKDSFWLNLAFPVRQGREASRAFAFNIGKRFSFRHLLDRVRRLEAIAADKFGGRRRTGRHQLAQGQCGRPTRYVGQRIEVFEHRSALISVEILGRRNRARNAPFATFSPRVQQAQIAA